MMEELKIVEKFAEICFGFVLDVVNLISRAIVINGRSTTQLNLKITVGMRNVICFYLVGRSKRQHQTKEFDI